MLDKLKKQTLAGLALALAIAFALATVPAHADKWASATFHTNQPITQVFERTAVLADGTKWGFRTTSRVESTNKPDGTIRADLMAGGEIWGCMYISIRTEGAGTSGEVVVSLLSAAWHNPETFADRLAKALHKSFPDLEYKVKPNTIPDDFAFGISQVSLPLIPPTTLAHNQSAPSSSTQLNSIQYSLQQIAGSLSNSTELDAAPSVNVVTPVLLVQPLGLGPTLMAMGAEMEASAAAEAQQENQATTRRAVKRFLSDANLAMNRFMSTTGSETISSFGTTAQAVNKARDDAYAMLANAFQRGVFNQITNDHMVAFGKQMADHASHDSIDPNTPREEHIKDLHQALDSWYANGKDWSKIPADMWNRLPEREKGRLKDGIDPETIPRQ